MKRFTVFALLAAALCCSMAWALPVRVLTTGDNHGWILAQQDQEMIIGGTAQMLSYWKKHEQYRPERFLVISAGDNVTGPDISTAFQGDPSIAVMNHMGYDVSVIGNHEFDFNIDKLLEWTKAAKFPFITANIVRPDGSQADFALPYIINNEQGVKVAIVGLTTMELHSSTNNAKDYLLIPYAVALTRSVEKARQAGAQVVVVAAHVPQDELVALAEEVKALNIPLMIGGHSHELAQRKVGETWVVNSGSWWDYYTRIDMDYNSKTGKTTVLSSKQVYLAQYKPASDRNVSREVEKWQKRMDQEFGAVVGHSSQELKRIPDLYNLVSDAYLESDPTADFAVLNYGALRQDWKPGDITRGWVLSLMPFTNSLLKVKLTGAQLMDFVSKFGGLGMSGLKLDSGKLIVSKTGKSPEPDRAYFVIMPNFIYDTTAALSTADPQPVLLDKDWRTPLYKWFERHATDKDKPLESCIDRKPRS